jgi:CheY-like chemotaxis protein
MRILIVDDSEESCEIIQAALLSGGYADIGVAHSASEAFEWLGIGRPSIRASPEADIILLDFLMPKTDGIEACARIRDDPRYGDTPIIMVTSLDDMDSLAKAFMAGANDYVTKPIHRPDLVAHVQAAGMRSREARPRQARSHDRLDSHYRKLLDQPIPDLGYKSPRAATRSAAGRTQVVDWLKNLESNAAKLAGPDEEMANYSFAWLWMELGVDDLRR